VVTVDIEWFRDLSLCILGIGGTVALLVLVVLAFVFYCRARPVLDSMKKTARTVARVSSAVEAELSGPLAQIVSFVQGCRQTIGLFNRLFRKEEEED
jgi:Na+-transporting methylmalonyl-CoA/oxaloacetate decarboxylase gamma subunit